jgi:teichuronic acid exporter
VNKQQIVKSGIWQLFNTAVIFISNLGYYAIMARAIPNAKEAFGILALLNACMNFGNVVAEAGMGDALLQRKIVDPQHKNAALYFSISTAVFFYLILFFIAPSLAGFFHEEQLVVGLRTIGLSFILYSLGSSSINLLQKEMQFKKIFFSDSLSLLASNVFGIVLAYNGFGVMSLVYSTLFYNTCKVIMLWIQEPIPLKLGTTLQHWKDLFNYGIVLTLIRITNYVSTSGINFLIGKIVPITSLGIFERSTRTVNLPGRYVGDIVQRISLPVMLKIDNDDDLFKTFYKSLSFLHCLLVPLSIFFCVFSKPLVLILLGPRWLDAVWPLHLMFLGLPFQIAVRLCDGVMRVKGLLMNNLQRKIISVVLLCILIYIGSRWGITGVSGGILVAAIVNYYIMLIYKTQVFPTMWKQLIIKPFLNGTVFAIYLTIPSFALFEGFTYFLHLKEVPAFLFMSSLIGLFLGYAFFKKPKLLGKDFAPVREVLMNIRKGKKKKARAQHEQEQEMIVKKQEISENIN